jgi:hypothetical protein
MDNHTELRSLGKLVEGASLSTNELIVYEFGRLILSQIAEKKLIYTSDAKELLKNALKNPKVIELLLLAIIVAFKKAPVLVRMK